ncbi:MAG: UDP-N-acetylmuramoyl-tripeptide--D-alanyl-D-alanine ligase [Chlamydiales bacterium]|nr:UDP-N-acetylmuramoyl-tripeptide--D-alanyl-D-alanine ligase [Chlamydiales bacterium]
MKERPLSWFAKAIGIAAFCNKGVTNVQTDSRKIQPGTLFFALKGARVDGHAFLKEVAEKGAVGAVVSIDYRGESHGLELLMVDDVIEALQTLARKEIEDRGVRVVAVTGSVGKTTTKEFLSTLLSAKYRVAKTPGNANSQVGIPLSILNSDGDEELFVMEMGMTDAHQIEKLVQIAPPYLSLITRIGLAHVGSFSDGIEGVARAKSEIFSHPKTRFGLYNADSGNFRALEETGRCEKRSFGYQKICPARADYLLKNEGDLFVIEEEGRAVCKFSLPFEATHLCEDFIASASAANLLGVDWSIIAKIAPTLTVYESRFEKIERAGVTFINDAYNANPTSMLAAFANLPVRKEGGRRIGVLGPMADLGALSEHYHREIGLEALSHFDHLLCIGSECLPIQEIFSKNGRAAEHFDEISALGARMMSLAKENDLVLIKGRNSANLWKLLEMFISL